MIAGLQIDVKSAELTKILKERLEFHEQKNTVYTKKAEELGKQIKAIEEDMEVGKTSGGTPVDQLLNKAREHREKVGYYKFMLEHVIQDDIYRLGQDDLTRLGITARYF